MSRLHTLVHAHRSRAAVATLLTTAALLLAGCGDSGSPTGPGNEGQAPTTGTISGKVSAEAGGSALSGVTITTDPATSTATTDAQGAYSIASVAPGTYAVRAAMSGYTPATTSVTVVAGKSASGNLTLRAAGYTFTQAGQIQASTQGISGLALSPDGKTLAYGEYGTGNIHIVNVETRQEVRTLVGHIAPVTVLAFSPDSRHLASQGTVNLPPNVDGTVRVWDVTTGTSLAAISTSQKGVADLEFSPDGTILAGASGGDPIGIQLWSATTFTLIRTISGVFRRAAFSSDGQRIATLARDSNVHIVEVATGAQMGSYSGHSGWATATAFDRTGTTLASGGEDRTIRLWSASNGQPVRTLTGHASYPDILYFSPDGSVLASVGSGTNIARSGGSITLTLSNADRTLRLWTVGTGAQIGTVDTGSDALTAASFSSDWGRLVTGSTTGLLRFFNR